MKESDARAFERTDRNAGRGYRERDAARGPSADSTKLPFARLALGVAWIVLGALVLVVSGVVTIVSVRSMARPSGEQAWAPDVFLVLLFAITVVNGAVGLACVACGAMTLGKSMRALRIGAYCSVYILALHGLNFFVSFVIPPLLVGATCMLIMWAWITLQAFRVIGYAKTLQENNVSH